MNKKGVFVIGLMELFAVGIVLSFGFGLWLINSSGKKLLESFGFEQLQLFWTGIVIVLGVLLIIKYQPQSFIFK